MSAQYQRFLKVLEKWPADKTKVGRDLGEQIRKHIKNLTDPSSLTNEANEILIKQLNSLERLSINSYGNKFVRAKSSTATGLTAEQCSQVLSSEFLQYLNDNTKKKAN